jgi:hypothetical protein
VEQALQIEHLDAPAALVQIPIDALAKVLPMVMPRLHEVAARSRNNISVKGMIEQFASGAWQLWVIWDGSVKAVLATEIYTNVADIRVCAVRFATGEDSAQWLCLIDDLENWARFNDCVKLDMTARKGWARKLPDYKLTHVVLEKDL